MFHVRQEESLVANLMEPFVAPVIEILLVFLNGIPKEKLWLSE